MSVSPDFLNQPQPSSGSSFGNNEPTGYLEQYQSTDRIGALVIAVSIATQTAFLLPMVERFETEKADSGEPGTFSFDAPLAHTQGAAQPVSGTSDSAQDYARWANPNDIIAIYAQRVVNVENVEGGNDIPVGPQPTPSAAYGTAGFIGELQDTTLLFVGMVDDATVDILPGEQPEAMLRVRGRDLTKIFIESESTVPSTSMAAYLADGSEQAGVLIRIGGTESSGTQLVIDMLNNIISKDYPAGFGQLANGQNPITALAYPWRNFIDTSKALANPYFSLPTTSATPNSVAFQLQAGSAYQNLISLRNAPLTRLYIDEYGSMVFDDALGAWTGTDSYGKPVPNQDIYSINEAEVLQYRFSINDGELLTYIAVWPMSSLLSSMQVQTLAALKGSLATPAATPGTQASPASPSVVAPTVSNYGFRYAQYQALWDFSPQDAERRKQVVLTWHNSIKFAEITVRGRPFYKVGARVSLIVPAHRPEFANASWYITNVSHQYSFGNQWVTNMRLRFPMQNGSLV